MYIKECHQLCTFFHQILKWMNRSDDVVKEYQLFLLNVCTAYSYHTQFAIEQLVACFSHGNAKTNIKYEKYYIYSLNTL